MDNGRRPFSLPGGGYGWGRGGVDHPASRLTEEQVEEIRAEVGVSIRALGQRYGVSKSTIDRVRRGESYSATKKEMGG